MWKIQHNNNGLSGSAIERLRYGDRLFSLLLQAFLCALRPSVTNYKEALVSILSRKN